MCSMEKKFRVVVPPDEIPKSCSLFGDSVVTMSQLMDELITLHRKCHCPYPSCTSCGSLKRQLPPVQLTFTTQDDSNGPEEGTATRCTLNLYKHFRSFIGHRGTQFVITAQGYSATELWNVLMPILERVKVSSLLHHRPSMDFSQIKVLEAHSQWRRESPMTSPSKDDDQEETTNQKYRVSSRPLFTPFELNLLTNVLVSPVCQLFFLELVECSIDDAELFCDAVVQCPTLLYLVMKECHLSALSASLLPIERNDKCDTSSTKMLRKERSNLQQFTLEDSAVDENALESLCYLLSKATNLIQCTILRNDLPLEAGEQVSASCMGHKQLKVLHFSGLDADEACIDAIARLVKQSSSLLQLSLTEFPQAMDVTPLAHAVPTSTLNELDLSNNRLIHMDFLAQALHMSHSLQTLNLARTSLDNNEDDDDDDDDDDDNNWATDANELDDSFFQNLGKISILKSLNLDGTTLTDDSMKKLAQSLRDNTSLECLQLNDLGRSVTFDPLFQALQENTSLKTLQLGRNRLSAADLDALVACLCVNRSIASLTMSGCDLTDDLILPLAQQLPYFRGLMDLDLSFNALGSDGVLALLQGVHSNYRLESIILYNSCWSVGGPTQFKCDGFEDENRMIQDLLRHHRCLAWPFRLQAVDPSVMYRILRDEIFPTFGEDAFPNVEEKGM